MNTTFQMGFQRTLRIRKWIKLSLNSLGPFGSRYEMLVVFTPLFFLSLPLFFSSKIQTLLSTFCLGCLREIGRNPLFIIIFIKQNLSTTWLKAMMGYVFAWTEISSSLLMSEGCKLIVLSSCKSILVCTCQIRKVFEVKSFFSYK